MYRPVLVLPLVSTAVTNSALLQATVRMLSNGLCGKEHNCLVVSSVRLHASPLTRQCIACRQRLAHLQRAHASQLMRAPQANAHARTNTCWLCWTSRQT